MAHLYTRGIKLRLFKLGREEKLYESVKNIFKDTLFPVCETNFIAIVQMRKLRYKVMKWAAKGHNKW